MGITWVHVSRFPEALPDPGALTHPPSPPSPRRKTGAKSLPGAQHRGEPQLGEPLDAGYTHHGLPCLGHGPSPHGRRALPEESGPLPWVHGAYSAGTLPVTVSPSQSLSPITTRSTCQQTGPFLFRSTRVIAFHMRKTMSVIIPTQPLLHSASHSVISTPP